MWELLYENEKRQKHFLLENTLKACPQRQIYQSDEETWPHQPKLLAKDNDDTDMPIQKTLPIPLDPISKWRLKKKKTILTTNLSKKSDMGLLLQFLWYFVESILE